MCPCQYHLAPSNQCTGNIARKAQGMNDIYPIPPENGTIDARKLIPHMVPSLLPQTTVRYIDIATNTIPFTTFIQAHALYDGSRSVIPGQQLSNINSMHLFVVLGTKTSWTIPVPS